MVIAFIAFLLVTAVVAAVVSGILALNGAG